MIRIEDFPRMRRSKHSVSTDVAPSSPSVGLSTFSQGHKHGNSQGRHRRSSASQSRVSQPSGWVSHPHTLTHTHPHKDHNWRTQGRSSREIEIDLTLCVDVEILMKPGAEHAPGRMNVLKTFSIEDLLHASEENLELLFDHYAAPNKPSQLHLQYFAVECIERSIQAAGETVVGSNTPIKPVHDRSSPEYDGKALQDQAMKLAYCSLPATRNESVEELTRMMMKLAAFEMKCHNSHGVDMDSFFAHYHVLAALLWDNTEQKRGCACTLL